ncbi:MAG: hypothetical protein V7K38_00665 [Nostoc sp.]|uniref:hypothetical protein n=1 Tax=Nostoc sp. TaxID=1180 RepID=UPI002FF59BB8
MPTVKASLFASLISCPTALDKFTVNMAMPTAVNYALLTFESGDRRSLNFQEIKIDSFCILIQVIFL